MTAAPQAAFLAHAEQQRDRRMVELLPEKLGRGVRKNAATGPVVAAERGLAVLTILRPCRFGLAPAHSGTVSICVMNNSRG